MSKVLEYKNSKIKLTCTKTSRIQIKIPIFYKLIVLRFLKILYV